MADSKITGLPSLTTPANGDILEIVDVSDTTDDASGSNKQISLTNLLTLVANAEWNAYTSVTPTRGSASDPEYTMVFASVDLSGTLSAGMKIKWDQNSTTRYGIITKVEYSTNTTITVYGGTDYDVEDTGTYTISNFYYSASRSPQGFPMSPNKWRVQTTQTTTPSQASPTASNWYNVGSNSLTIPTGAWDVEYFVNARVVRSTAGDVNVKSTLSTGSSSETDTDLTGWTACGDVTDLITNIVRRKTLDITTATAYYLNLATTLSGISTLQLRGDNGKTIIRATCAYL